MASICPLKPSHAAQVWELSRSAYPGTFHLSISDLEATLSSFQPEENYCFGAFEGETLTAYLMCWIDTSQVEERYGEPVLLLDDIVVTPRSKSQLIGLLRALRRAIVARGKTDLAIEGTHREQAEALFNAHPRVVELLGYRLVATHHYFGEREAESLCWARYEPV